MSYEEVYNVLKGSVGLADLIANGRKLIQNGCDKVIVNKAMSVVKKELISVTNTFNRINTIPIPSVDGMVGTPLSMLAFVVDRLSEPSVIVDDAGVIHV